MKNVIRISEEHKEPVSEVQPQQKIGEEAISKKKDDS